MSPPAALSPPGTGRPPRPGLIRRTLPGEPLLRNGHLLAVSSVVTCVLGAGYWALATRLYPPAAVGRNYSAISVMMLLAGIGQLNLTDILVRFVPAAGRRTRLLVGRAYLAGIAATTLLATGFVLLVPGPSADLGFLDDPLLGGCFIAASAGYGLFIMQDGVLTGLRRPDWVVLENGVFAVVKIGAVALPMLVAAASGILLSWVIGLGVAIAVTSTFLFAREIPRHTARARPTTDRPTARYILGDNLGALCWLAATTLPPLIVLEILGADQAAYFSLTWVIAYVLFLVSENMGSSLVVESSTEPGQLTRNCRRVLTHTGALLAAAVALLVAAAPGLLRLFGPGYAQHGTGLLRLLLLAALPNLVVTTAVSVSRARQRIGTVIAIFAAVCVTTLGLTVLLLPAVGIIGAGLAWLAAETLVALALLARPRAWLGTRLTAGIERVPMTALAPAAAAHLRQLLGKPADRRLGRRLAGELHPNRTPRIFWVSRRLTDTVVVHAVGDHDLVIKHPASARARQALHRQYENLRILTDDERLGDWRRLLPRTVACDLHGPLPLTAEEYRPGLTAATLLRRHPDAADRITAAALSAIAELHHATGTVKPASPGLLRHWIDTPLDHLRRDLPQCRGGWGAAALDTLRERVCRDLAGQPILTSWTHGDFDPDNVLMSEDGHEVTGIVDWATAQPDGPAPADTRLFNLALQRVTSGEELGAIVVHALREAARDAAAPADDALLLLTWLRHVADNLNQSSQYPRNQAWAARNVTPVLREVAR